jgi:hypothetical protein
MAERIKSPEDFKEAAKANGISKVDSHNCSICGYTVGYQFSPNYEEVKFDHGCDCTGRYIKSPRTWQYVADDYNRQSSEKVIAEMNKFWGFE